MAGLPFVRPSVSRWEWSVVVGVGASWDGLGTLAARLSIDVLMPPRPVADPESCADCSCGDETPGEERPGEEETPLLTLTWGGAPGALDTSTVCEVPLGVGSSKSDSVGRDRSAVGLVPNTSGDARAESCPESECRAAPTSGVPT
jgi:hypothetical protein